jgi:hypothetical protein
MFPDTGFQKKAGRVVGYSKTIVNSRLKPSFLREVSSFCCLHPVLWESGELLLGDPTPGTRN